MSEEDAFEAALSEAQELMDSLAPGSFAIDSDDEEATEEVSLDHPLAEGFLSVQQSAPVAPLEQAPAPMSSTAAANAATGTPTISTSPANLDAWKQQTTRFASNIANMAQRAAHQATEAANFAATAVAASPAKPVVLPPPASQPMTSPAPPQPTVELDNEQKSALIQTHVGDLLPGERVIMFLTNLLHVSDSTGFSSQNWCCAMTYFRILMFATHPEPSDPKPDNWHASCWPHQPPPTLLQMPLCSMERVEKSVFTTGNPPTTLLGLLLVAKDNGRFLKFTTSNYNDTIRAYEALQTYAFPGRRNLGYLFAFESKRNDVLASVVTDEQGQKQVTLEATPKRFDALQEYGRQLSETTGPWKIWTQVNQSYQLCASYPSVLVGPASLDEADRVISGCASFRSEQRLPSLTWSSGVDGASLWRASQPKVGLQGNRSSADELYMKHILESASAANAMSSQTPVKLTRSQITQLTGCGPDISPWVADSNGLKIMDLRPRASAMANRTGGYGYENTAHYTGTTLQFCNIGNIHAVRDSYQKLSALCMAPNTNDVQWHASVEDTKWLSHIRLILSAAWETAYWIHIHRLPVLLHCSHGWDRTSQVAVLAELLLDPFYRTRRGLSCLIEKDFMSFGHPFHTRCAHGEGSNNSQSGDEGQVAPIFLQFLDCLWQLVNQFPECFEFNAKYLLLLSEHVYSCRFGNFLCDTERERELVAGIRQRTHSLWEYLESVDGTKNLSFHADGSGVMLMPLPMLLRNVSLWVDRHCAYGAKPTLRWMPHGGEDEPDSNQHGRLRTMWAVEEALHHPGPLKEPIVENGVSSHAEFTVDDDEEAT